MQKVRISTGRNYIFFKRLKSISVNLFSLCLHLWRLDVERRRKFKFHWAGKYLLQQSCKNLVYLYKNICPIFKKDFKIMLKCWKTVSCVILFLHWFQTTILRLCFSCFYATRFIDFCFLLAAWRMLPPWSSCTLAFDVPIMQSWKPASDYDNKCNLAHRHQIMM